MVRFDLQLIWLRFSNTAILNAQSQLIRVDLMTVIFVVPLHREPRRRILGASIGLAVPSYLHTRASSALLAVLCQLLKVYKLPFVLVDEGLLGAASLVEKVAARRRHVNFL